MKTFNGLVVENEVRKAHPCADAGRARAYERPLRRANVDRLKLFSVVHETDDRQLSDAVRAAVMQNSMVSWFISHD